MSIPSNRIIVVVDIIFSISLAVGIIVVSSEMDVIGLKIGDELGKKLSILISSKFEVRVGEEGSFVCLVDETGESFGEDFFNGFFDGIIDWAADGINEGDEDGFRDKITDGIDDGIDDGLIVGVLDGSDEGITDDIMLGPLDGSNEGDEDE